MEYGLEELASVVSRLAESSVGYEHTSLTYERVERLMEAVLYCIHEWEQQEGSAVLAAGMTAQQAYEAGAACVREKVGKALELYHGMLPGFVWYGNRCLYDTVIRGMPEFFKWYDVRLDPQNTILTLDYPVLRDMSGMAGIDRIYEYLVCIDLEQRFLRVFPEAYMVGVLTAHDGRYRDMIGNLCEIVLADVLGHVLAGSMLDGNSLTDVDRRRVQAGLMEADLAAVQTRLTQVTERFVREYCGDERELAVYLTGAIGGIVSSYKERGRF